MDRRRPLRRADPFADMIARRKAQDECKFTLVSSRPAARTALALPAVRPLSDVPTEAKRVGRSFRMILSISKPAPAASDFEGLCPHARLVQGRSLPRPAKSRGACAVPRRFAVALRESL
jgi:hypothetical protein